MLNKSPSQDKQKSKKTVPILSDKSCLINACCMMIFTAIVWILYSNTLNAPFYFDDFPNIVEDPSIRLTELSWESFSKLSQARGVYRPASSLSFALNYYFGGYEVVGYHLVNIVIHILGSIFLFLVIKNTLDISSHQILSSSKHSISPNSIAFFTAMLWLVHPLHTESVTYIVQRENSQATMFYIMSLLLYINGRNTIRDYQPKNSNPKRLKRTKPFVYFTGCVFSGFIAITSKQNAATLPFFILLYEWFFFQNLSNIWTKRKLFQFVGVMLVFCIISLIFLGPDPMEKISPTLYTGHDFTIFQRLLSETRVVIYYLSLIFFPHPSRLNLDYNYSISNSLIDPITTMLCFLVITLLIGSAIRFSKKDRILAFCILWYLGNLAIESSFIGLALIFEHRTYLSSMMVCLTGVVLLFRHSNSKWFPTFIFCVIFVLFSIWTYQRNLLWSNEVKFWADCINKSPQNDRPYANLGLAYLRLDKNDRALDFFKIAVKKNPLKEINYYLLGKSQLAEGNFEEAIIHLTHAHQIKADEYRTVYLLGNALLKQGNTREAIKHLQTALIIRPQSHQAMNSMGKALLFIGDINESIYFFEQALNIAPEQKDTHNNLGNALLKINKNKEAIYYYNQVLTDQPNHVEANINMGVALTRINDIDSAMIHFQNAIIVAPDNAEAHNNLGVLLIKKNQYIKAKNHFKTALQLRPNYASARANLQKVNMILINQ
jgi:tetratricopeptide (TPR) repeat protein